MIEGGESGNAAKRQIEVLRKKLLDLTLRNRMLNYRPSKRFSIEILGEDSVFLHKLLVEDGKRMTFVGTPDPVTKPPKTDSVYAADDAVALESYRQAAVEELDAFIENPVVPIDQLDTKLNSREHESILQAKLRAILREARTANEEMGINTLFLTLGALHWQEESGKACRAPLLFVPVKLDQQSNGSVRLTHDGSDVGGNLPLKSKLFELNLKLPDWDEEKGVNAFLNEVESTVRARENWRVERNEVNLAFFTYEKYSMYIDLGGDTWPEGAKPWDNADIRAIFSEGYSSPESNVTDSTHLDPVRPVANCREIFDADSSQTIALVRAAERLSMVVEGPPGTGKSQTIANIIAEAVAAGKTVLFVSAKRAALEVVKRRLTEADLGPMCLDLHDKLTNRREFYAELKKTADRGVTVKDEQDKVDRLTDLRDRLNAHADAMNEVLLPWNCSPFTAMSLLAKLPPERPEDRDGRIAFESLREKTSNEITAGLPAVRALQERLRLVGIPVSHPFWGCAIDYVDPALRLDLEQDLTTARDATTQALKAWSEATAALRVTVEPSVSSAKVLTTCVERAIASPPTDGVALNLATWNEDSATVLGVTAAIRVRNSHRAAYVPAKVTDTAWRAELRAVERAYAAHGAKWFSFLFSDFRQARATLDGLLTNPALMAPQQRLAAVQAIIATQEAEATIQTGEATMRRLFGEQWRGVETDPELIERLLKWVLELRKDVSAGQVPAGFLDFFTAAHNDPRLLALVKTAEEATQKALETYLAVAKTLVFPSDNASDESLNAFAERLDRWQGAMPKLGDWIAFGETRRQANNQKLESVVEVADRWPGALERLEETFLRSYYSGVIREAMQLRPELRTFERAGHEAMVSEFQLLDDFKLRYNRAQVRLAHQRRMPTFANAAGNLLQLKLQCELTRKHKPIRWILRQAGEAVQRIKPVFMMSPLTVAIHLPPELPAFDMVIFDEASQIKPEDALCAIARCKQCIVVGDTRQMPPTSFFDRLVDDDDLEEEADAEIGSEARKLESVLSLMSAVVLGKVRRPDLRWHYRSVHPSLIQPSNEMFYDNRLIVFPSPENAIADRRIGLTLKYHPETIYEAGSKFRINRAEAELVANRTVEHLQTRPEESLLIAAMNKVQADLIDDLIAIRERQNPELFSKFRALHPHEPLTVKNLETVQGDERDFVIVSVTYGRDSAGVIRQQFGPILQDGGERRLNVLFTRARRRCEVFTNMRADDIRVESLRPGLVTLKRFLSYAETGDLGVEVVTGGQEESPFEEEVSSALRDLGYIVDCQVGSEGFRIDLAIVDPEQEGRYILGIECDGATYHSARSARDRDKLRQRVLEVRGWKLHRIWSRDWWQDREAEIQRVIQAIESATDGVVISEPMNAEVIPPVVVTEADRADLVPAAVEKYVATDLPETMETEADLKAYIKLLIETEGPIHRDLLFARVRVAAGVSSARGSTRRWLDDLIDTTTKEFRQFADAIYADDVQIHRPRDWSERPTTEKRIDYVTQAEIAAAIRAVVRSSYGIAEEDVAAAALKLLGFRKTSAAQTAVASVLAKIIEAGGIRREPNSGLRVT